jgi:hypothetical protein
VRCIVIQKWAGIFPMPAALTSTRCSHGGEPTQTGVNELSRHIGHVADEFVGENFDAGFGAALAGDSVKVRIFIKGDDGEPSQRFRRVGGLSHG